MSCSMQLFSVNPYLGFSLQRYVIIRTTFGSYGSGSGNPVRNLHIFRDNDKNILEANLALQSQSSPKGFPIKKNYLQNTSKNVQFFRKPQRLLYNFHCCTLKAFDIYLSGEETAISCNSCFSPPSPTHHNPYLRQLAEKYNAMMPPVSSTWNDLTRLYTLRCTVFEYILPAKLKLKGDSVTRFSTSGFLHESVSPSPWVSHYCRFEFFRKFAEIFAAQGAPPV